MGNAPMTATLTWQGDLRFRGVGRQSDNIVLDGDGDGRPFAGRRRSRSLAGCMAMDVVDIVSKGRHPLARPRSAIRRRSRRGPAAALRRRSAALRRPRRCAAARRRARDRAVARQVLLGVALAPAGHRFVTSVRGHALSSLQRDAPTRLLYLDWLRGVAVVVMVLAHVTDSWTRDGGSHGEPFYTLLFIAGLASPLFLFLAGRRQRDAAASKRAAKAVIAPAPLPRGARGWEIFALGLLFRLQAQLLGLGPLVNFLKVDMLNMMGLAMVAAASYGAGKRTPDASRDRAVRVATAAIAMITPLVRATPWLAPLPDPIEAYLRPAGSYAAFPLFPWAGFLFAGRLVGELVDAVRASPAAPVVAAGRISSIAASWRSGSPGYAVVSAVDFPDRELLARLADVLLHPPGPASTLTRARSRGCVEQHRLPARRLQPLATLGRSSLFVYWIHVEMVYGVIAEPLKRRCRSGVARRATALLRAALRTRAVEEPLAASATSSRGPLRILAPVVR